MHCRFCGWGGNRDQLNINYEADEYHPRNRKLHMGHPDLYKSRYEECPNCRAVFFEDDRMMPWLFLQNKE